MDTVNQPKTITRRLSLVIGDMEHRVNSEWPLIPGTVELWIRELKAIDTSAAALAPEGTYMMADDDDHKGILPHAKTSTCVNWLSLDADEDRPTVMRANAFQDTVSDPSNYHLPGGITVAYCRQHKTAWQIREGEEPAGCVGCGTATSPMWGTIKRLEDRVIACEQRQREATEGLKYQAEMNDIKLGNRISALSYRVEQVESRYRDAEAHIGGLSSRIDTQRVDADSCYTKLGRETASLVERFESTSGDIASLGGRVFALEQIRGQAPQRRVWCEHYQPKSINYPDGSFLDATQTRRLGASLVVCCPFCGAPRPFPD